MTASQRNEQIDHLLLVQHHLAKVKSSGTLSDEQALKLQRVIDEIPELIRWAEGHYETQTPRA